MKKLTQSEVISKFEEVWSDLYDYSLTKYIDMKTKIDIICHNHGLFKINPNNHINRQGCKICANENKSYSLENFIELANKKHNSFYDYSKVEYNGFNKEISIICPLHGEFKQKSSNHLKYGCKICGGKDNKETFIKKCNEKWNNKYCYDITIYKGSHYDIEYMCPSHGLVKQKAYSHLKSCCPKCSRIKYDKGKFIEKSIFIHNNVYDYSLVNSVSGINDMVEIICKNHGQFTQKVSNHLKGDGCQKCYYDSMKLNFNDFIIISNSIHNHLYDYTNTQFTSYNSKVNILCKKHGEFYQLPNHHLRGSGCPICKSSKGELKIIKYLKINKIEFVKNKKFEGCKYKNELPFDFYLPNKNICIEYDGEMHFKEIERFGGKDKLKYYQNNDNIKNEYCKQNNIYLIRIKYTDYKNIDKILKTFDI